jgi:hypothetical protein
VNTYSTNVAPVRLGRVWAAVVVLGATVGAGASIGVVALVRELGFRCDDAAPSLLPARSEISESERRAAA